MSFFDLRSSTGRIHEVWPVLLLLAVVAVPTIAVLWFVGVAVENQQLAAKQQLTEAYQSSLWSLRAELINDWQRLASKAAGVGLASAHPGEQFAAVCERVPADSMICLAANGQIVYPNRGEEPREAIVDHPRWAEAMRIENAEGNYAMAQQVYAEIAKEVTLAADVAFALQGQVRCLLKANRQQEAIQLVLAEKQWTGSNPGNDSHANQTFANIELMALENTRAGSEFERIWSRLHDRVFSGTVASLSGSQRLFIMRRMANLAPGRLDPKRLVAEELAAQFVAASPVVGKSEGASGLNQLRASPLPDVWVLDIRPSPFLLLWKTASVQTIARRAADRLAIPPAIRIELLPPNSAMPVDANVIPLSMGETMPGWRLWLSFGEQTALQPGLNRTRLHLWTAALVVLFTSVLALVIVRSFQSRLRVANLKSDLVGTVSHELKTPLASMRLLVDTLLSEQTFDPSVTREYLGLINKENVRLSRLIENFLTFSRMDQNRHAFKRSEVPINAAIHEAVESLGDRLRLPQCELHLKLSNDLPLVLGDYDGLVTVFLNLLDNAQKYSGKSEGDAVESPCEITITSRWDGQHVRVVIGDNGMGMSRAAQRRAFDRFFQVDQKLMRSGQGCGLGLSIVDYVVKAHSGRVTVASELGSGSEFEVLLPGAQDDIA